MKSKPTPFEVTHHQDAVVELYLDHAKREVIELYHRAGGREDRIVHSAQSYLQKYASYPIGKKVLNAMVMV